MTSAEFETFLHSAGYAFETTHVQGAVCYAFADRACPLTATLDRENPDLLVVTTRSKLPEPQPAASRIREVLREVEAAHPVVKLRYPDDEAEVEYVEVRAEQFVAEAGTLGAVFWKMLESLEAAAADCFHAFFAASDDGAGDPIAQFALQLEAALRLGAGVVGGPAPANVIEIVRPALAMTFDPKGGTGSAFCVASDEQRSLYVTNAHVVAGYAGLTLYRQDPEFAKMTATVVARGTSTDLDLAVLSVPVPHVASVTLRATPPDPGARVALAGYPRVLIWAAPKLGGIAAAVYEATVNEINPRGTSMLHDAVSRPGCSGGPIFDPATGYVFGVNWAGYDSEGTALAVGLTALTTFLDENGVAYRSELDERSGT